VIPMSSPQITRMFGLESGMNSPPLFNENRDVIKARVASGRPASP
jgi:hypothetical protein